MGYSSRIYFVRKSDLRDSTTNKHWAEIIATVELCGAPEIRDLFKKHGKDTEYYVIDNNEDVYLDSYGEILKQLEVKEVYDKVLELLETDKYRRYVLLKGICEGFLDVEEAWHDDIIVLHYGH